MKKNLHNSKTSGLAHGAGLSASCVMNSTVRSSAFLACPFLPAKDSTQYRALLAVIQARADKMADGVNILSERNLNNVK